MLGAAPKVPLICGSGKGSGAEGRDGAASRKALPADPHAPAVPGCEAARCASAGAERQGPSTAAGQVTSAVHEAPRRDSVCRGRSHSREGGPARGAVTRGAEALRGPMGRLVPVIVPDGRSVESCKGWRWWLLGGACLAESIMCGRDGAYEGGLRRRRRLVCWWHALSSWWRRAGWRGGWCVGHRPRPAEFAARDQGYSLSRSSVARCGEYGDGGLGGGGRAEF